MKWLTDIGTVPVKRSQLELWRDGTLGEDWARRFDAGDRVVLLFRERGRGKESDVEVEHRGGWVYTLREARSCTGG